MQFHVNTFHSCATLGIIFFCNGVILTKSARRTGLVCQNASGFLLKVNLLFFPLWHWLYRPQYSDSTEFSSACIVYCLWQGSSYLLSSLSFVSSMWPVVVSTQHTCITSSNKALHVWINRAPDRLNSTKFAQFFVFLKQFKPKRCLDQTFWPKSEGHKY